MLRCVEIIWIPPGVFFWFLVFWNRSSPNSLSPNASAHRHRLRHHPKRCRYSRCEDQRCRIPSCDVILDLRIKTLNCKKQEKKKKKKNSCQFVVAVVSWSSWGCLLDRYQDLCGALDPTSGFKTLHRLWWLRVCACRVLTLGSVCVCSGTTPGLNIAARTKRRLSDLHEAFEGPLVSAHGKPAC